MSDLQPGAALEAYEVRLTRADLVRYAGASGDLNPIHWSDRVAGQVGLPGVIAHGMLTLAVAARAVEQWCGGPEHVVDLRAKFTKPVVVPDDDNGAPVRVEGTVKGVEDGLATIDLTVTSGEQKVLGASRAVVRV